MLTLVEEVHTQCVEMSLDFVHSPLFGDLSCNVSSQQLTSNQVGKAFNVTDQLALCVRKLFSRSTVELLEQLIGKFEQTIGDADRSTRTVG